MDMLSRIKPMNLFLRHKFRKLLVIFRSINWSSDVIWFRNLILITMRTHSTSTWKTNFMRIFHSTNIDRRLIWVNFLIYSYMSKTLTCCWISSYRSTMHRIWISFNNSLVEFGKHACSWRNSLICTRIWYIFLRYCFDLLSNIVPEILHMS